MQRWFHRASDTCHHPLTKLPPSQFHHKEESDCWGCSFQSWWPTTEIGKYITIYTCNIYGWRRLAAVIALVSCALVVPCIWQRTKHGIHNIPQLCCSGSHQSSLYPISINCAHNGPDSFSLSITITYCINSLVRHETMILAIYSMIAAVAEKL